MGETYSEAHQRTLGLEYLDHSDIIICLVDTLCNLIHNESNNNATQYSVVD